MSTQKPRVLVSPGLLRAVFVILTFWTCVTTAKEFKRTNSPVKIDLFMMDYFLVKLGVPGTRMTMRIDLNLDCIKLLPSTSQNSMSFMASSPLANSSVVAAGSEVFNFRTSRVRLPVMYTAFDIVDNMYLPDVRYVGIMGLGLKSPLWKVWDGFSITPSALYLGSSPYTTVDVWKNKARYYASGTPMRARVTGIHELVNVTYYLSVDRQTEFTRCPKHVYGVRDAVLEVLDPKNSTGAAVFRFPLAKKEHVVIDMMGKARSVILPNRDNADAPSTSILLGKWSLRGFILHWDMRVLEWTLYPAREVFGNDVNSESAEMFCLIAAFVIGWLSFLWLLFTTKYGSWTVEGTHIPLCIKIYGSLWCVITLIFHAHGYHGHRFLNHYLMHDVSALYTVFIVILVILLVADMALSCCTLGVLYTHAFDQDCVQWDTLIFVNKIVFEPVSIVVMWLCLLTDQSNIYALIKELGVSLLLLVVSVFNALNSFLLTNAAISVFASGVAVLCYLFFIFMNVAHVFREYWGIDDIYPSWFVELAAAFFALSLALCAFVAHNKVITKARLNCLHVEYKEIKGTWSKKKA